MNEHIFLDKSRHLLIVQDPQTIERCLAQLTEDDIWWRPNENANSIGNLLLHLDGNVRQWIIGAVANRSITRNRQQEFDERTPVPSSELMARLRATLDEADGILAGLDAASLQTTRRVFDRDVTVLEAIYHVVAHFSLHTGQIALLMRIRTGKNLELWLSRNDTVPRHEYS